MANTNRFDPYRNFKLRLEIDGVVRAGFHEASGMNDDAVIEDNAVRKLPGLHKYSNITLKRGLTDDHGLLDWHKEAATAKTERKNGSIVLTDESGVEKARWNFKEGWPVKLEGPTLKASANEVAIETLELAHEGLTLA